MDKDSQKAKNKAVSSFNSPAHAQPGTPEFTLYMARRAQAQANRKAHAGGMDAAGVGGGMARLFGFVHFAVALIILLSYALPSFGW